MKPVILPFGKTIYQTDHGQSITSDTAFVVETILEQIQEENLSVLELGSGNGIISIMLAHYRPNWQISGLEIQKELMILSKRNAELAEVKIDFQEADLKNFQSSFRFDLIISNPPYFPVNQGKISPIPERAISRHEISCKMIDIFQTVKRNLKPDGKAFLLYPEERLAEAEKNVKKVDLKLASKFIMPAVKSRKKIVLKLEKAEEYIIGVDEC
ncbi:MAG: methyltransferase [Candidatus Cloacimonadales bacterium]|nr:methyltransferase [Candidatus Cloacimonadales bacterium]